LAHLKRFFGFVRRQHAVAVKEILIAAGRRRFGMVSADSVWFACPTEFRNRFGNCWLEFCNFMPGNLRSQLSPLPSLSKASVRTRIGNGNWEKSFLAFGSIGVAWVDRSNNSGFVKTSKVGEAF
jgi:hypothetical protein